MIDYNARLSNAILGVGFAIVQVQAAQALTNTEASKVAKSITVMIQNAQNSQDTGSGVIIKREDETYTVLTAHHVVRKALDYMVMTPDHKLYSMVQGSIKPLPGVDLALIQFRSADTYSVAQMGDSSRSRPGSLSFVAGFPGVSAVRPQSEYYFTSGAVVANGSLPDKDGYALVYSNLTFPGMSGGPVLNEQGELIGIHGRAEKAEKPQNAKVNADIYVLKTEVNYAVPINTFLTLVPPVNDFFLQAEMKYKRGDLKGAIASYDQAIILDRASAVTYNNREDVRDALGDWAIASFERDIRFDPKSAVMKTSRGFVLGTKYALLYLQYGSNLFVSGDKKGAIIAWKKAAALFKAQGDEKGYQSAIILMFESK